MRSRRARRELSVVLSCEHGGNSIPAEYRRLFDTPAARAALNSHRGWDPGSLEVGRVIRRLLNAPLIASTTSRLLVELNRSPGHPRLFSEWTKPLPKAVRLALLDRYYHPHRAKVLAAIAAAHDAGNDVLHLSLHTFTPVWDGIQRPTDIGLLFDPARKRERTFCNEWQRRLRHALPDLRTHRNRPYRGTSDGLTTSLRRRFPPSRYLGIELEVNQRFFADRSSDSASISLSIARILRDSLNNSE